jgi:tRNA dimethylallyltransferase
MKKTSATKKAGAGKPIPAELPATPQTKLPNKLSNMFLGSLPKLIVVLGPTAVGKSDLAVEIAKKVNGEVISADSRQIYKGLNIGSGKITKKEMQGIKHYGLDIAEPKKRQQFTASKFKEYADEKIADILARGKTPILCGGTGFYIDAVVDGIVLPGVNPNPELRRKLRTYNNERLSKMLAKLDPKRHAEIHINNTIRLIRAIEIAKELGNVPALEKIKRFDTTIIGLDTDDEILKEKIHARILKRLKQGMISEAQKLRASGVTWKRMKEFGLEYGLLADLLQEKITRAQFIERLDFDIWHYVKRQRAWFKRRDDVHWFNLAEIEKKNNKGGKNKGVKKPLFDVISKGLKLAA